MKTALMLFAVFLAAIGVHEAYLFLTMPPYLPLAAAPVDPSREPRQVDLDGKISLPFVFGDGRAMLAVMAKYDIAARVEGVERYRQKPQSLIAPHDICLSWGRMATEDLRGKVKFSQSTRWCRYYVAPDSPVDMGYVANHAANVHVIYGNDALRRVVARLDEGDIVQLTGYLVYLDGAYRQSPMTWHSSLRRDDTGNGACELLYLTSVRRGDRLWGKPVEFD